MIATVTIPTIASEDLIIIDLTIIKNITTNNNDKFNNN